ncbi:beta-1,3-galactosyltransferase 5 [Euwallacea similis]|uniref:beta-1,3-galactosyltransferase 5 n=1 Tax=Euwallacea similis TaxID=1736056 RepID=UPI00344FE41B
MSIFNKKRIVLASMLIIFLIVVFNLIEKNSLNTTTLGGTVNADYLKSTNKPAKLFNTTFKYLLNAKLMCNVTGDNLLAVFIITSYFGNTEIRNIIRKTFNKESLKKLPLKKVFLLGETHKDKFTKQQTIQLESEKFEDIVQGNFIEAYRNLTYKHTMGLKWAGMYCPNVKYVIKMDDDTIINMHKLEYILNSLEKIGKHPFIAGYKMNKLKPIRVPTNKWFVTSQEYFPNLYPTFVSGWFYVTTPQVALALSTSASYYKFFWIDDVFVTGILANALKIQIYDISKYFVVNAEFLQCCLQDFDKAIDCDKYIGPNGGDVNMFLRFNEKAEICVEINKCNNRSAPLNDTCIAKKKVILGRGNPVIKSVKLK